MESKGALQTLRKTVQRFANRENLDGHGGIRSQGHVIAMTKDLAPKMGDPPAASCASNPERGTERGCLPEGWQISRSTSVFFRYTAPKQISGRIGDRS